MATKAHQQGLRERVEELIRESGGRTEFITRVWGADAVDANKGKVAKWVRVKDPSGMRADEAKLIAERFDSRPAWLLYGEEPRRKSAERPIPTLAQEVRSEVLTRAFAGKEYEPEFREFVGDLFAGEDLLDQLAEMLSRDVTLLTEWYEQKIAIKEQIHSLKGLRQYGKIRDVVYLLLELDEKLRPPHGEVLGWRKRVSHAGPTTKPGR